jgi:hypothetical protein
MNGALFVGAGRRRKASPRRGLGMRRPGLGPASRRMPKVPSDETSPRGIGRFPVKCVQGLQCERVSEGAR